MSVSSPRPTILVVDDEPVILALIRKMLGGGYRVLTAVSAREALDLYRDKASEIDLLLVDVIMPGTRGTEVVAQCRKQNPNLRFLYMSGYSEDYLANLGISSPGELIRKPFLPADLLERVDQVLAPR
jgi:two-component system, cell cycle sensor histidine kinase and response regulator CckA